MATRKTNGTNKTSTTRKDNKRNEQKNNYPDNKIVDFGILNGRSFVDSFGNDGAYFDLDLGFILIKGLVYRQNKDGVGYVTFQSEKGKDNNYYKRGYINDDCLLSAIRDAVEDEIF